MTIPLTGAGSFGVRMGHLMAGALDELALAGGTATTRVLSGANLASRVISTIEPDYANGTAAPQVIDGILAQLSSTQQNLSSSSSQFQTFGQNTMRFMYGIDQLGISSSAPLSAFSGIQIGTALAVLISQMVSSSSTVQAPTVSAGSFTAVGSPVGNPVAVVSLLNGQGYPLPLCFPETMMFTCSADSYTGGRTSGNELLKVLGQASVSSTNSPLWPAGSGLVTQLQAIDGSKNNSTGNTLQNSDFQTFTTTNVPDNWTIVVGTAGTQVLNGGSGNAYTPGSPNSLEFAGDGSTLTSITQQFNTTPTATVGAGGTSYNLVIYPDNVFHCNLWIKCSSTPAAGVLQIDLVNGSGTIIQDDQGNNCSFSKSLTTVSTSYIPINGAFRLPKSVPSTVKIRIHLTTALSNTVNLFIARCSMANASNGSITNPLGTGASVYGLYSGGPFVTIHSGSTPMLAGLTPDSWTLAISNNYSTSGSGLFQQTMERWFGLRSLGLQLPAASSTPTISDSLIT